MSEENNLASEAENRYVGPNRLNYIFTLIKGLFDELKKSVSDGKSAIASAITRKGVSTASDATFATMASNIAAIPAGTDVSDTTATTSDVLEGKVFHDSTGTRRSGMMNNIPEVSIAYTTNSGNTRYAYYNRPTNIEIPNSIKRYAMIEVPVNGYYADNTSLVFPSNQLGDASSDQVLKTASFSSENGIHQRGSIETKSAVTKNLTKHGDSISLPAGYYSKASTITASGSAKTANLLAMNSVNTFSDLGSSFKFNVPCSYDGFSFHKMYAPSEVVFTNPQSSAGATDSTFGGTYHSTLSLSCNATYMYDQFLMLPIPTNSILYQYLNRLLTPDNKDDIRVSIYAYIATSHTDSTPLAEGTNYSTLRRGRGYPASSTTPRYNYKGYTPYMHSDPRKNWQIVQQQPTATTNMFTTPEAPPSKVTRRIVSISGTYLYQDLQFGLDTDSTARNNLTAYYNGASGRTGRIIITRDAIYYGSNYVNDVGNFGYRGYLGFDLVVTYHNRSINA